MPLWSLIASAVLVTLALAVLAADPEEDVDGPPNPWSDSPRWW